MISPVSNIFPRMSKVKFFPKVICLWVAWLTLAETSTRKELAEDIIERVLGIPNSDKGFNSVLGRLQKNRQGFLQRLKPNNDADCNHSEGLPEYSESLENSRDRGMRHIDANTKHDWICHVERTTHRLNTTEYEYRPAYYEEVRCNTSSGQEFGNKDQLCSSFGLSCVQWTKTIHLIRRRYTSDCWETKTLVIPAGCECMWPVHK